MRLKNTFLAYRKSIVLALLLVVIEKTAWIIEPTVFGDVIDAMIDALAKPPRGSPTIPLLIWIGIFAINSGVGTFRRAWDEKVYLRIYNELVTNIAQTTNARSLDPSRAAARAELTREVISFYQYRIPDLIEQAIDVFGATLALTLFDWRLGATCFFILLPVILINRLYNHKVILFQKHIHDQQEDVFRIFSTNNVEEINSYYSEMAKWKRKIANWGAANFGILRLFLLGIFLVILYVAIDLDNFTTGNIYSIAAYVWTFITSSEYLPEQLESWTSTKEISDRLEA
jgi:ABC-type multidrug transport system fused ATPase/permease subunit